MGCTSWAEGLPVPAACVAQEPKWGQTWDGVLDRAVQGVRSYRAPARQSVGLQAQGADQAGGAGAMGRAKLQQEGGGPGALIQEATLTDPSCVQTPQLQRTEPGGHHAGRSSHSESRWWLGSEVPQA